MKTKNPRSQCIAHSPQILYLDYSPKSPNNQEQKSRQTRAITWIKGSTIHLGSRREYLNQMVLSSLQSTPMTQWFQTTKWCPLGARDNLRERFTSRSLLWRRLKQICRPVSQQSGRTARFSNEWRWRARLSLEYQGLTACTKIPSTGLAMQ